MSKIVFFCIPAHGHTNPTLGVVRELVERGIRSITTLTILSEKKLKLWGQHLFPVMIMI